MGNTGLGKALIAAGTLLGLLSLSGCGTMRVSSFDTLLKREPSLLCQKIQLYQKGGTPSSGVESASWNAETAGDDWDRSLERFLRYEKGQNHNAGQALDDFLDCTVADIGPDAPEELKVYRAYLVLAVLSRYAAFNYTGQIAGDANLNFRVYSGMHDDALATLSRIDTAERVLRAASGVDGVVKPLRKDDPTLEYMSLLDGEACKLPTVSKLHRTLAVLLVASSAEKPTLMRAKNWVEQLAEAASGALLNRDDLVDQGLKVVGKSLTLKTFGNSYLDDVRCDLESHVGEKWQKGGDGKCEQVRCQSRRDKVCGGGLSGKNPDSRQTCIPTADEWKYWALIIKNSCARIATSAGTGHHCLSDWKGLDDEDEAKAKDKPAAKP